MPIRALLRTFAAGVLIVASAGAVAANATGRQTAAAFAESTMPTWTQAAQTMPRARPLVAQLFADSRGEQAARIRAQMERMEARARADDRLNGRIQPRDGGGRGAGSNRNVCARNAGTAIRGTGTAPAAVELSRRPISHPGTWPGRLGRIGWHAYV